MNITVSEGDERLYVFPFSYKEKWGNKKFFI